MMDRRTEVEKYVINMGKNIPMLSGLFISIIRELRQHVTEALLKQPEDGSISWILMIN